jgi:hypothetical protein
MLRRRPVHQERASGLASAEVAAGAPDGVVAMRRHLAEYSFGCVSFGLAMRRTDPAEVR